MQGSVKKANGRAPHSSYLSYKNPQRLIEIDVARGETEVTNLNHRKVIKERYPNIRLIDLINL